MHVARGRDRPGGRCAVRGPQQGAEAARLDEQAGRHARRAGRAFAFARTERFAGTVEWTYRFEPEGSGTRVTESYEVTNQLSPVGWFIIGVLFARKDRRTDLHTGMEQTLERMRAVAERAPA